MRQQNCVVDPVECLRCIQEDSVHAKSTVQCRVPLLEERQELPLCRSALQEPELLVRYKVIFKAVANQLVIYQTLENFGDIAQQGYRTV